MDDIRFLTWAELKARGLPFCRRHTYRLEAAGAFPRRVQIGQARVGWIAGEVDAWIAARVAERDQRTA
jgi:prophage regulatory protein